MSRRLWSLRRLRLLSSVLLLCSATSFGWEIRVHGPKVPLQFRWPPPGSGWILPPNVSTSEFVTNIYFNVYSTTNGWANWYKIAKWEAFTFMPQGPLGSPWSNYVAANPGRREYAMTCVSRLKLNTQGEGVYYESEFSNVAVEGGPLPKPHLVSVK